MTNSELVTYCGSSAAKWAEQFCKKNPAIEEDYMLSWFANCIEETKRLEYIKCLEEVQHLKENEK